MNEKIYTQQEVIERLRRRKGNKTFDEFAKELRVSGVYIRTIFNGSAPPGRKIGFERVKESIRYREVQ